MRTGYLRQDESLHWYLVPEELKDEFAGLSESVDDEELFEELFNKYRLNSNISRYKFTMES